LTSDTQAALDEEWKEIEIKNVLVPIDGSEYSLQAAKYATRITRNERAQLFCIHVVTPQRFKFFHRHTSSPSPSSDHTKQEPLEEQRLISYES
jgi:nucleotide-binding universal stress UspA family protein